MHGRSEGRLGQRTVFTVVLRQGCVARGPCMIWQIVTGVAGVSALSTVTRHCALTRTRSEGRHLGHLLWWVGSLQRSITTRVTDNTRMNRERRIGRSHQRKISLQNPFSHHCWFINQSEVSIVLCQPIRDHLTLDNHWWGLIVWDWSELEQSVVTAQVNSGSQPVPDTSSTVSHDHGTQWRTCVMISVHTQCIIVIIVMLLMRTTNKQISTARDIIENPLKVEQKHSRKSLLRWEEYKLLNHFLWS